MVTLVSSVSGSGNVTFAVAAPVAEFLFIAGGTDTALAGVAVVGGGTGVRKFIIGSLF